MLARGNERVCLRTRRHGIVLVGSFVRAAVFGLWGTSGVLVGWPVSPFGVVLLFAAAAVAVRAVWRWERTRLVVTREKLVVVHGTLRRRSAAVRLGTVEVEQGILGRLLGYGTIVAGDLEITHVPKPRRVVERLSA
jgi:membrane protein YdbS with pleckstrin-like domain